MKRLFMLLIAAVLCVMLTVSSAENVPGSVVITAENAVFTEGKGLGFNNKKDMVHYDADTFYIENIPENAVIEFTVPAVEEGMYDIYLTISRIMAEFTSQPFSYQISDGEWFSVPVNCQLGTWAAKKNSNITPEEETIRQDGRFLIRSNVALKEGMTIRLKASFGAKAPDLKGVAFPAVRALTLVEAGTPVPVGYDYTIPETEDVRTDDPLSGKTIIWIGSSVTYGAYAEGHYSMVDAVADLHPALTCEKYAISATTLVNQSESSYVSRLKMIPKEKRPDLVVVQLSTNDATTGKPFGEIAESFDIASFDDTTIAGAIETIIAYTRDTFGCPVMFYSGAYCEKENYSEMVQLLLQIEEKWNIGVIDLFNNADMTAIFGTEQYKQWMFDQVHPNKEGYVEWWTPVIDSEIIAYMTAQD